MLEGFILKEAFMRRILVSALGLSALSLFAQQPAAAPAKPAAPAKMEMPKPGPEMAKLQPLVGSFRVAEHIEASPWSGASQGAGFSRVSEGPGGFSVLVEYTTLSGVMHGLKGHGVLGWDDGAKAYREVWTDSMGPNIAVSTGNWDGDNLVMNSEGTMMGKPYKERDTFSAIGADGFTLTIEMSMDGSPMQKAMELIHHRMAPKAAPAAAAPASAPTAAPATK